jgi:thioredoxin-like negative regulator of GroEL
MLETNTQTTAKATRDAIGDMITSVTFDTFTALVLEDNGPVAVEFMSYGCGHCRALEHPLQEAALQLELTEKIFRVNIAIEKELSENFDITGTPTLVMFLQGQEISRVEGPSPNLADLQAALTAPFQTEESYNEYVSSN